MIRFRTKEVLCGLGALLAFVLLTGCCMKSITTKPELSIGDLTALSAAQANADVVFQFQDCCPNSKQKDLALALQSRTQQTYDDLLAQKITLDQYNAFIKAANDAITTVILVCKGGPAAALHGKQVTVDDAWKNVETVVNMPLPKSKAEKRAERKAAKEEKEKAAKESK